jgi:hypothetical protein
MSIDVFLVKDGTVANIALVESLEQARALFPDLKVVERTDDNKHINVGEQLS